MKPFVGRENELKKLKDLSKSSRACLVVLKGRRRIGKSRLAEEFGKGKKFLPWFLQKASKYTTKMNKYTPWANLSPWSVIYGKVPGKGAPFTQREPITADSFLNEQGLIFF